MNVGDEVYIGAASVSLRSLRQWNVLKGLQPLSCPCKWKRRKALVIKLFGEYCYVASPSNWLDVTIMHHKDLSLVRTVDEVAKALKESENGSSEEAKP